MTHGSSLLDTLDIEPQGPARAAIIWLHGLGANAHDFEPIVPYLGVPPSMGLRFVFPNAPTRPVTVNGGMVMRAWYDILGLDLRAREDEQGIRDSETRVRALIERETARGIPADRIVLAGFSQGGVLSLQTMLRHREALAGAMILSGYLPLAAVAGDEASPESKPVPIFMGHGRLDEIIPIEQGRKSRKELERLGYTVEWHEYAMPHSVCPEEIEDIGAWLRLVLPW